jgi:hypothetical protein
MPSEPFPGVLGALLVEMYGGPQPSAPTPWLQPQDHYTAKCETRDGANVLELEPIANARKLNPAPDPSWGLHLTDGNIALGDLIAVVKRQTRAYLRRLALRVRCVKHGARVRLAGPGVARVRSVRFRAGGRLLRRDRRAPFTATVRRARLRGRTVRVRAVARLAGGAHATVSRRVRGCS